MKKQNWIIAFVIILAIHLIAIAFDSLLIEYISKPLIIASLVLYFGSATSQIQPGIKKWILLALIFSWIGDVLLLFQPNASIFFLLGLSAFLVAHIFYIVFFHHIRTREKIKGRPLLLVIVVIYYLALILFLSPYLADMKLPVRIYGIIISFMFMLAMHALFIKNKIAGRYMASGALLFVASDSLLAIDKFYQAFNGAGLVVMLTYGLAQLFITEGAIQYIRNRDISTELKT